MHPLPYLAILAGALFLAGCSGSAPPGLPERKPQAASVPPAMLEPARPADALVDSIGVATHWGFRNTIYGKRFDDLQRLLGELGIRHVRDSYDPRLDLLWQRYGISAILITEPVQPWDGLVALWRAKRPQITAIEGSNEVNGSWAKLHLSYQGKAWPEGCRLFQDDLYRTVKSDDQLRDIPVIACSLAYKNVGQALAPLRSFDYANAHSYAGGRMPSLSLDFLDPYLLLGRGATAPPLVATESGYHTCLGESRVIAGNQQGVSQRAQRKYLPRQIAEYFNAGLVWTVLYEFAAGRPGKGEQDDPEAAFGLLTPEGAPKPAYAALRDLIAMLSESRWDAAAGTWRRPAPFRAQALGFSLSGAPASLHHTLLQRSDGSFQLLLWNEVPSFDLRTRSDLANPEIPVRLVLERPAARITVRRLGPDAPAALSRERIAELELAVPDEVIVVSIEPAEAVVAPPCAQPAGIVATADRTTAEFAWPEQPGADGYRVALNRRDLGPATRGADGRWSLQATGLLPATTYVCSVTALSRLGGVSDPLLVRVTTRDAFPDLVVRSIRIVQGAETRLVAVIENTGTAPVDPGLTIGVKFALDGRTVSWSDHLRGPLPPGAQVEATANSGPQGAESAHRPLPAGRHRLGAMVDDVNRIIESEEQNNRTEIEIEVAP